MGLFSKVGDWFNDLTGSTSAAKLQNKYQKEFAQNAHQWEVADLKKAGLNPILSAGGSGANAGGSGGTTGSSGVNPIETGLNLVQGSVSALNSLAQTKNINQDTIFKTAQTQGEILNNLYKSKANPALIKQAEQNLELTMRQIALTDKTAKNIEANTAKTTKELSKIDSEIFKNNSETRYNNRRAGGYSKSTSASGQLGGSIGGKMGISGNLGGSYSSSETW